MMTRSIQTAARSTLAALALAGLPFNAHASSPGGLQEFLLASGLAAFAGAVLGGMRGEVSYARFLATFACGCVAPALLWASHAGMIGFVLGVPMLAIPFALGFGIGRVIRSGERSDAPAETTEEPRNPP